MAEVSNPLLQECRSSLALRSGAAVLFGIACLWPTIADAMLIKLFDVYRRRGHVARRGSRLPVSAERDRLRPVREGAADLHGCRHCGHLDLDRAVRANDRYPVSEADIAAVSAGCTGSLG